MRLLSFLDKVKPDGTREPEHDIFEYAIVLAVVLLIVAVFGDKAHLF
jgi:hypothetical protein